MHENRREEKNSLDFHGSHFMHSLLCVRVQRNPCATQGFCRTLHQLLRYLDFIAADGAGRIKVLTLGQFFVFVLWDIYSSFEQFNEPNVEKDFCTAHLMSCCCLVSTFPLHVAQWVVTVQNQNGPLHFRLLLASSLF